MGTIEIPLHFFGVNRNYGPDNALDFELPEELLSILPMDPYEQLELACRITSIAVGSWVSKLEVEASKFKIKITEKDQRIYELEEKSTS
jgi:hypothetical protein